jgi:hypothetical protein
MTIGDLLEYLEAIKDEQPILCFQCGEITETRLHRDVNYHPWGSTAAREEINWEYSWCNNCRETEIGANLIDEIITFLKSDPLSNKPKFKITKGHLLALAEAMDGYYYWSRQ